MKHSDYNVRLVVTKKNRFDHIIGIFDDDITDLSTSVRDTMNEYYEKKSD